MSTMDGIIDTVPAVRPLEPLISLLKTNGKVVTVGIAVKPLDLPVFPLTLGKQTYIIYDEKLIELIGFTLLAWGLISSEYVLES